MQKIEKIWMRVIWRIIGLTHLRNKINYSKDCELKLRFRQLTVWCC